MTDIVERLRDKWQHSEDDCYAAADEIERLREELYEIKLAAAGGEDAPGAANMVTAKDIEKWTKEMWTCVRDREAEIERLHRALQKANIEIEAAHELVDALTFDSAALGEGK